MSSVFRNMTKIIAAEAHLRNSLVNDRAFKNSLEFGYHYICFSLQDSYTKARGLGHVKT